MPRNPPSFVARAFSLSTFASFLFACSNAVTAVVGSVTVICSVHSGSTETSCVISREFPSSEQTTLENDCTGNGGTVVGACPSSGLVGCCTTNETVAAVSVQVETCAYSGTATEVKSQCSGVFSTTP
jgi:hypothetical protein